jgi:hypothetical protein
MKSENKKLAEILESKKGIFELIINAKSNQKRDNLMGDTLIELIAEIANANISKIAKAELNSNFNPSIEIAETLFKEISDNIYDYKVALSLYNEDCKDDAFDVLKEIYPNKSDAELRNLMA